MLPILSCSTRNSATQNPSASTRNLLFDGHNSQVQPQLYQISALIFILSCIKLVKICFKLLKHSIFELQNCNIHLKKCILIFLAYIIAEKLAKLQSHIASLKMHRTHAHRKFHQNGFVPAHRNLLPHIATRNLQSHIASLGN